MSHDKHEKQPSHSPFLGLENFAFILFHVCMNNYWLYNTQFFYKVREREWKKEKLKQLL